ncbi:antA/AntB antirepressor family protein [Duganella hordei]|uniref:antA/AntB antirepressor family protein n=1 Tax=Duganella hordei TaxID=2865934 RepID=UPI0030EA9680
MSAHESHHRLTASHQPESAIAKQIPIGTSTIDGATVQTTNARDLYAFLKIGKDFSNWIKMQIVQARLVEARDFVSSPSMATSSQPTIDYHLTLDAGKHLAMLSKAEKGFEVREYFLECERRALGPARAPTPAEMFLQNAQMMVDIEQRQLAQGEQIDRVEQRVCDLATSMLMLARPAGAESIVHIRERINKLYGLPSRIIDEVLRQSPIAPKPAGMVKHSREEALGGSYAVYWIKDVSATFARFVGECERVTATQAEHPYVEGRFKLAPTADRPAGSAEPSGPQAGLDF